MRNYQTRLARLRELKPPPPPPGPPLTYTELAAQIETLLSLAKDYPDEKVGRYTLGHRAGLARSCFEDARKRRAGIPHYSKIDPLTLTPEERLTLLVENMEPRRLTFLYVLIGATGPEVAWMRTHYVLKTVPDLGDQDEVRRAAEVTERLGRLGAISPVEDVGAADVPQLPAIIPLRVKLETDTLGDDAGAIETLPAPPEPSPPPETPALPPERKPRPLIRSGGLRPAGRASGPWR